MEEGLKQCKTKTKKEADGETSEKRTAVETETETVSLSEMEHSGQLVPTNNSLKKKKKKKQQKKKKERILIEVGKDIDVKGFLSSKNRDYLVSPKDGTIVPVSSLEGKYVLICCFSIPFDLDTTEAALCQTIQALYSRLSDIGISDFVKLVIVLQLEEDDASAASAFDSFFSWFPLNCLAIPHWDSKSRHYVCRALGFCPPSIRHPCLAIHPSGLVLSSGSDFLQFYGARSFPFTSMHLDDLHRYDEMIKHAFSTKDNVTFLQLLLECDHLSQFAALDKSVPISHLFDTPVGLYLYSDGYLMNNLRALHKSCLDKGLKFAVVVVPVPFDEHYDPVSFYDRLKQSALEDEISSSWWLFPFNDDICRTLWRLTYTSTEGLVILPHGDLCGDIEGHAVASRYGIDGYPFTKDVIVQRKVNHLRSLTLDRLLGKKFTDRWDLHNKNVLLCFERPSFETSSLYKLLKKGYWKIKQEYPDCEIVLVRLYPRYSYADTEIDWRILPSRKCETVINHIFTDQMVGRALCAFGKDGKLLSRSVWECLQSDDSLFENTLYTEILDDVMEEVEPYV